MLVKGFVLNVKSPRVKCKSMVESSSFHSQVSRKDYRINFSFKCDSSSFLYLFDCVVCGLQYVGSTSTPFKIGFNNYKACYRKSSSGSSFPQMDSFRHFFGEGHRSFLEDIRFKIIDKLLGKGRIRESFWQHKLDTFTARGLNVREVGI